MLALAALGVPVLKRLGAVIDVRVRKLKPEDLPPVPWIGHC
jgi:hypothetical protein